MGFKIREGTSPSQSPGLVDVLCAENKRRDGIPVWYLFYENNLVATRVLLNVESIVFRWVYASYI